jgi:uncharacterized membrane protein YoaK (UPF0700 family)
MLYFDVHYGKHVRSFVETGIGPWQIDGFAVRPDLDKPGVSDNAPNHAIGFWGVYGVRPLPKNVTLDAYYLGLDRKTVAFDRGVGHEVRHSIGAHLSRPVAEMKPGWDLDYEGLWQFGTFGSANISAWTVASETGYRFPNVPLKPRFSVKADVSSGDDPRTNTLGTFNPLFPKGNYFGVLATAGPGPINFIDAHPRVEATLPHGVTVSVDWIFQWRESLRDGVYSVPGFLIIPAGKSNARFVGNRPGTEVRWQANRHLSFQADYGIFLCRQICQRESARPQPELLGVMGGIQVLGANRIDAGENLTASTMNNSSTVGNPTAEKIAPYVLLGMTAVTGLVDAVSFLWLGRVFTANMTGNVVILASATARIPGLSIARSLTAFLSFLVGAIVGGRIMALAGADSQIRFAAQAFLLEVVFLFAASFCAVGYRGDLLENSFQPFVLIALTALAMGTRNAAVRKLAMPDLTTTVLTLTITGIAADSSFANGNNSRLARRVASLLAMFFGAAFGAVVIHYSISAALWLATTISAVCSAALFRYVRTSDRL